jgi:hypothetical protein
MAKFTLDDSDGFLDLEIKAGESPPIPVKLDLFESNNVYAGLCKTHEGVGNSVALAEAWVEWLMSKGCPRLSHGASFRLADQIVSQIEEFKKKGISSSSAD